MLTSRSLYNFERILLTGQRQNLDFESLFFYLPLQKPGQAFDNNFLGREMSGVDQCDVEAFGNPEPIPIPFPQRIFMIDINSL